MARKTIKVSHSEMVRDKARSLRGSNLHALQAGYTLLYICPPVHEEAPTPHVEAEVAFQFGPKNNAITRCERLVDSEPFLSALKRRKVDLDDVVAGWEKADALLLKFGDPKGGFGKRWTYNVVCLGHKTNPRKAWDVPEPVVEFLSAGKQIFDGLSDLFFDEGDICDPDAAIFAVVKKEGTGMNTEYSVKADTDSLKSPVRLDDDLYSLVEAALVPGGDGDIHAYLAAMCRPLRAIEAAWSGVKEGEVEDDGPVPKARAIATRTMGARRKARLEVEEDSPAASPEADDGDLDELDAMIAASRKKR